MTASIGLILLGCAPNDRATQGGASVGASSANAVLASDIRKLAEVCVASQSKGSGVLRPLLSEAYVFERGPIFSYYKKTVAYGSTGSVQLSISNMDDKDACRIRLTPSTELPDLENIIFDQMVNLGFEQYKTRNIIFKRLFFFKRGDERLVVSPSTGSAMASTSLFPYAEIEIRRTDVQ